MSQEGPKTQEGPKQLVLDLNTVNTLRAGLKKVDRSNPTAQKPVAVTVAVNQPAVAVTVVAKAVAQPVAKTATVRQAKAPVPNPNARRPLPQAPAKKVAAPIETPPPVPPRDDVVEDTPPPVPPRDEVASVAIVPPAPPVPPVAPKMPTPVVTNAVAKPALLFSAADLASKKLKKTETVDKSAPVIAAKEVNSAVVTSTVVNSGAIMPATAAKKPGLPMMLAGDDELKRRIQESAARRSMKL